jgi:hypothetical protein
MPLQQPAHHSAAADGVWHETYQHVLCWTWQIAWSVQLLIDIHVTVECIVFCWKCADPITV